MAPIAPIIKEGGKIYYPIYHDECCFHANDQSGFVWMREGEQPLRNKSRGRIVHVSDFIIEHSGRLCLSPEQIEEQMKLPVAPVVPAPTNSIPTSEPPALEVASSTAAPIAEPQIVEAPKKGRKKKDKKAKNTRLATSVGRTAAEHIDTVLPPPPAGFTEYRLPSFDARRIIHPGANYDPWWDMPQLILQVFRSSFLIFIQLLTK
jgi:hypothetical protein